MTHDGYVIWGIFAVIALTIGGSLIAAGGGAAPLQRPPPAARATTRPPHPAARPRASRPAPELTCAFYSPAVTGQQVIVWAQGPACRGQALEQEIARLSGKPWATTALVMGTDIADMTDGPDRLAVYQTGFATGTEETAGYLADALEQHGWRPIPGGAR